jgi:1-acyl-sn-glycerol-3-phosphate acyltransferase
MPAIQGEAGVLVLINHQSVLDIPLVVAALPIHLRIVTRGRYASGKLIISHMGRLYQYPVVEPTATVPGRLRSIGGAAQDSSVPIVLYPEGTRTRDGLLESWSEGELRVILGAWQWTVKLIVADGLWQTDRLTDFVNKVSSIDSRSVVVGPFVSPEPGTDPEPFIAFMRVRMKAVFTGLHSEELER